MHAAWLSVRVPGQAELQTLMSGRAWSAGKRPETTQFLSVPVLAWREVRVQGASSEVSDPFDSLFPFSGLYGF